MHVTQKNTIGLGNPLDALSDAASSLWQATLHPARAVRNLMSDYKGAPPAAPVIDLNAPGMSGTGTPEWAMPAALAAGALLLFAVLKK